MTVLGATACKADWTLLVDPIRASSLYRLHPTKGQFIILCLQRGSHPQRTVRFAKAMIRKRSWFARQNLRQSRRLPVPIPKWRAALRNQLRRPRRQIYGPARGDIAEVVMGG
jgi:hypothetical protein